jgi:uncharacterized protein
MRIVTAFARPVRRIEHCMIPVGGNARLAARIWLPDDADTSPVPAILEYVPYRKRDFTRVRDEPMHHWLAGHGYAAVRVDVRGSGESDGVLSDEYAEQELADGVAVIEWLASQPWCTGAVGMIGKSWGGFNALQIAARRPAPLRAVIAVCASDDRYADDAHYMGGCLLNENLTWGSVLLTFSALPPDPALVGARWRDAWLTRLDHAVLFPALWLEHQHRDDYWKRGSVCEEADAIRCAVWAVGGWADGYTNAVPRLVGALRGPRRGLIGPWGHVYPHTGVPGPAIGFLQEARRWFDRWTKDLDPGVDEPLCTFWMADGDGRGRWVTEAAWPSARIVSRRWALNPGRLDAAPGRETRLAWRSPQTVGGDAGDWCSFGDPGDGPGEQSADDAGSLLFDSAPLDAPLEILGTPSAELVVTVDRPRALLAVRLNEVREDGSSVRVTYGLLNLTSPASGPLEPGRRYAVGVPLKFVAHAFRPGSRLRLAISTAYWPIAWPSPEPVTLTVFTGASALVLPVRPHETADVIPAFERPEGAPSPSYTELRPIRVERTVEHDVASGEVVHTVVSESGPFGAGGPGRLEDVELDVAHESTRRYRIRGDDPLSARADVVQRMTLRRAAWEVTVVTSANLSATADHFELDARLEAFEGATRVRSRTWKRIIPRDGV